MDVSAFNKIGTIDVADSAAAGDNSNVTLKYGLTTVADYRTAATAADFIFVNYNVTQVVEQLDGISLAFGNSTVGAPILVADQATTSTAGLLQLTGAISVAGTAAEEASKLWLNFTGSEGANGPSLNAAAGETLFVDIFTFGDKSGYDRQNNAIYRLLLEETDDNTGVFIGDVEFIMINQINTDVASTYSTLDTLSDEISIIVHEDLTDEDSPRINYLDLGADGVSDSNCRSSRSSITQWCSYI